MNSFKRIVIAVDNSAFTEPLTQNGFELVKRLKAEAAVVSVIDTRGLLGGEGLSTNEAIVIERNATADNLNIIIKNVFSDYPITRYILEGEPCEKILSFATDWSADMLILGTHGRKGLSRLLLGSIAEKVLKHSHLPVMIIPLNHG